METKGVLVVIQRMDTNMPYKMDYAARNNILTRVLLKHAKILQVVQTLGKYPLRKL